MTDSEPAPTDTPRVYRSNETLYIRGPIRDTEWVYQIVTDPIVGDVMISGFAADGTAMHTPGSVESERAAIEYVLAEFGVTETDVQPTDIELT
jgi:hypothetical protein